MKNLFDDLDEKELENDFFVRSDSFYKYTFYDYGCVNISDIDKDLIQHIALTSGELNQLMRLSKLFLDRRENKKLKENRL